MIRRAPVWTLLFLAITLLGCANPVNTKPEPLARSSRSDVALLVPLCSVVASPAQYDGKRVTVEGCVTTDGREYVALSDLEKPCREGSIVPIDTSTLRAEHRFQAQAGKKVCGTFTGTFRASTVLYNRVLEVEETSNLQTSALK